MLEPLPGVAPGGGRRDVPLVLDEEPLVGEVEVLEPDETPPVAGPATALDYSEVWLVFDEAIRLAGGGNYLEAIPLLDQVIASLRPPSAGELNTLRAAALLNLVPEASSPESTMSWQWLLDDYGESADPYVQPSVVLVMYWLGVEEMEGDPETAIAWFDRVIDGPWSEQTLAYPIGPTSVEAHVVDAMWFKAKALSRLGDEAAARAIPQNLLDQYSDATDPMISEIVSDTDLMLAGGWQPSVPPRRRSSSEPEAGAVLLRRINTQPRPRLPRSGLDRPCW